MTENASRLLLKEKGFDTPVLVLVVREVDTGLQQHTHPFKAMALILEGDITIGKNNDKTTDLPGDVFHLLARQPHHESFGNREIKYLSGR
ncbi:cupin [Erwinia psidii]|uniref:cupin n=1 Tax=Erwinia psidii TaxID=69224 RepID=UPI00226B903A|nr:cupin [Erwinia psidii]MCX8960510.1 cupin [Erwinia psidii]